MKLNNMMYLSGLTILKRMKKPNERSWRVLSSEYISHELWFTVRHECVELPSGVVVPDYYIMEYPDWVNIIARDRSGRFVFISQYRHGLGTTSFEIPAGTMEPSDESPLESAKRELQEETGYCGGEWRELMRVCANPATQSNTTHCFIAEGVEKLFDQSLDSSEDIEVELFSLEEVRELLTSNSIPQALMVAPLWRYIAELER